MSLATLCNACTLRNLKDFYGEDKVDCHRMSHREEKAHGFDVLADTEPIIIPWTGERAPIREQRTWYVVNVEGEDEPVAFFMELTVGCAC